MTTVDVTRASHDTKPPARRLTTGRPPVLAPPRRAAWFDSRANVRMASFLLFIAYAVLGMWLLYGIDYVIGDALARSAAARYVVAGRDPHLAAIGFVWLPLPTFVQIPFAWVLGPFGLAAAAGPISTAVAAALTFPVLAKTMRVLDVDPAFATAILAIYTLNPVTAFYAANGMSESLFFLFLALSLLGYVSWLRDRKPIQLATLGFALAGAMLVRYETVALMVVFGAGVAFQARKERRLLLASTTVMPGVYALLLWLAMSFVLVGDAFFFATGFGSGGPSLAAPWLPRERTLANGVAYALDRSLRFGAPFLAFGLIILVVAGRRLIARTRSRSVLQGLVIVAAGAVFPAHVAFLMSGNRTWGNPRYFTPLLVVAAVAAAWLFRETRGRRERRWQSVALRLAVVTAFAAGCLGATVSFADPKVSAVESEPYVFGRLPGLSIARTAGAFPIDTWRSIARDLDRRLRADDLVIADTHVSFPAVLFTKHPDRFMIPSDRDYEELVASRLAPVTYAIFGAGQAAAGHPQAAVKALITSPPAGFQWVTIGRYSVAEVYHLERSNADGGEGR